MSDKKTEVDAMVCMGTTAYANGQIRVPRGLFEENLTRRELRDVLRVLGVGVRSYLMNIIDRQDTYNRNEWTLGLLIFDDRDNDADGVACLHCKFRTTQDEVTTEISLWDVEKSGYPAPRYACAWLSHGYWNEPGSGLLREAGLGRASAPRVGLRLQDEGDHGMFLRVGNHVLRPASEWPRQHGRDRRVLIGQLRNSAPLWMDLSELQDQAIFVSGICDGGTSDTHRGSPHDLVGFNLALGQLGFRYVFSFGGSVNVMDHAGLPSELLQRAMLDSSTNPDEREMRQHTTRWLNELTQQEFQPGGIRHLLRCTRV